MANTYTQDVQYNPAVASDAAGNFMVVWVSEQQYGPRMGVFGQRYDRSGVRIGTEFQVSSYTTHHQLAPAIASDGTGRVIVAWEGHTRDSWTRSIWARQYDLAGLPGPEFRVNTHTSESHKRRPSVAMAADGSFVVVWESDWQDGHSLGVFGQRFDATGLAQGNEFQVNSFTTWGQLQPAVAMDASGRFVVTWTSYGQDGSSGGVFGQRYDATGAPQGPEFRVNSATYYDQLEPAIAMDADGRFVIVWTGMETYPPLSGVFGQRFNAAGAPEGGEFHINSFTSGFQADPAVSMDGSGNFIVAWMSQYQDGDGDSIRGRAFEQSGTPQGDEFPINTYTTGPQVNPSVAAAADGRFVVLWDSDTSYARISGVLGQRFAQDLIYKDGFEGGDIGP